MHGIGKIVSTDGNVAYGEWKSGERIRWMGEDEFERLKERF